MFGILKNSILLSALTFISGTTVNTQTGVCPEKPDPLYDRIKVQKEFIKTLDKIVVNPKERYYVRDGRPWRFYIYDLTDPSNKSEFKNPCVDFIDGHVYHFSPVDYWYSRSLIAILKNGEIKIFKSINVVQRKHKPPRRRRCH